jgi:hypothetical protein
MENPSKYPIKFPIGRQHPWYNSISDRIELREKDAWAQMRCWWSLFAFSVPVVVGVFFISTALIAIPVAIIFGILALVSLAFAIQGIGFFIEAKKDRARLLTT